MIFYEQLKKHSCNLSLRATRSPALDDSLKNIEREKKKKEYWMKRWLADHTQKRFEELNAK